MPLTTIESVAPDVRVLESTLTGAVVARLGYGVRDGFAGAPGRTGFVGWYEASDGVVGAELLRRAVAELYAAGAERVIGPLEGSTWHRYRLMVEEAGAPDPAAEPPFLGEPVNPPEYPDHFEAAGFLPHLEYESRIVRAPRANPALQPAAERLRERGVEVAGIALERFEETIREIHELSLLAFAGNPYFTPIQLEEFTAMYAAVRPLADPALVRLARDGEGRLLGFVFAYVDPLAPGRVILKTLATHPDARGLGLGGLLTDAVNAAAGERGAAVIHALMQVTNFSKRISARSESELFRRYRLYQAARA
jgi:ribosomal protein S18 acetylase RimI-like enzyme